MTPEQTDKVYELSKEARHGLAASMMTVDQILHVARQAKGLEKPPLPSPVPPVRFLLVVAILTTALVGAGSPEKAMPPYAPPGADFARGNRAMQDRNWDGAIAAFRDSYSRGGDPAKVLPRLAEAQYYARKPGDALLTCDLLDNNVIGSPHGAYVRALIALDDGDKKTARREFGEAQRCDHPLAGVMLARCR